MQCLAAPDALDAFDAPPATGAYRVAPDELLVLAPAAERANLIDATRRALATADPDALVLDTSDGWSVLTMRGPETDAALGRLSAVRTPASRPAFVQAAIGEAPARAIVLDDAVHILISSTVAHHVRARVLAACADLGIEELAPAQLEAFPA